VEQGDIMLYLIFPNQLTYTQTQELRTKMLFMVSGFNEVNNAARDMKTSILKDGINTSANLFHFCEVKNIFKFIKNNYFYILNMSFDRVECLVHFLGLHFYKI
jgi:hypothetical protein